MTPRSVTVLLLAAALASSPPLDAAPRASGKSAAAAASLSTVNVSRDAVTRETAFDGAIEAVNQSTVAAQTGGRVTELAFDVGDRVEPGALIVRLTDTEQRAALAAAKSSLAEARARRTEAQIEFRRARDAYKQQAIPKAQYDRAEAAYDAARARADAAEAAVTLARKALDYTEIMAPYGGIVAARHVQLGETVAPGTPLMTGLSLDALRVAVEIPQQHIGPLRAHRDARVILPDGRSVDTASLRFPPAADPVTHTFRVLATLPEGVDGIYPGTLVKVAFVSGRTEQLTIPPEALVRRGEVTGAYVVDDADRISLRYLRVGTPGAGGRIPVLAGLAAGERVATDQIAAGIAYKAQGRRNGDDRP